MVDDSWNRVYQDPNVTEVTKLKSVLTWDVGGVSSLWNLRGKLSVNVQK